MHIDLTTLSAEGVVYEGTEDAAILGLTAVDLCQPDGPIHYVLTARRVQRRVVVNGRVELRLTATCRRCGRTFSTVANETAFLYEYLPRVGQLELDVTPEIREAVLLRLPSHPLCSESCPGLCPHCGRDLRDGPCDCAAPDRPRSADPWAALDEWSEK